MFARIFNGVDGGKATFVRDETHVFMVLLEVDELFLQGFDLALQVQAAQVSVVDELPQADDVSLNRLADGQLRLVSEKKKAQVRKSSDHVNKTTT